MAAPITEDGKKYNRIYRELRAALMIGRYGPGGKLPSEKHLGEQFGASRPTVARALAKLATENLVARRTGSGTYASTPKQEEGYVFGLLIAELGQTEIFEPICQGISHARMAKHHELLWGPTSHPKAPKELQAEQLCQSFLKRSVSGVFFAPLELTGGKDEVNLRICRALDEARIPVVLLDRDIFEYPKRSHYDLVGIDNRRAGYTITEHLLVSGSKRIVFFARPNSAPTVNARVCGYRDAITAHLASEAIELVEYGDPSDLSFVHDLVERLSPEAFVCANDYTAAQLMASLNTLGIKVPSRVKIVGVDDIKYASLLHVPLTTIHQPCLQIGSTALLAMQDRLTHPDTPPRDFLLGFRLVVRQSSGNTAS